MNDTKIRKLDDEYSPKIALCDSPYQILNLVYKLLLELELYGVARELDILQTEEVF